jgi:hypothetical protein
MALAPRVAAWHEAPAGKSGLKDGPADADSSPSTPLGAGPPTEADPTPGSPGDATEPCRTQPSPMRASSDRRK